MDLAEHFRTIWRRRGRVVLASLLIAASVFTFSRSQPSVYRATGVIGVTPGQATGTTQVEENTLFLTRTYAELAETRPVLEATAQVSGLRLSPSDVGDRLSARASSEVGFIRLSATGPTPAEASRLANSAAQVLVTTVRIRQGEMLKQALEPVEKELSDLRGEIDAAPPGSPARVALEKRQEAFLRSISDTKLRPTDEVAVIAEARGGSTPVSPRPVRDALFAFLAALVVNSELAVLLAALADRFSTRNLDVEIGEVTGLPVLARIPEGSGAEVVEAFRALRTNLVFMETSDRMRTLAVVSVDAGAGKSFTSANLARSATSLGFPVVLVDGDLRRPTIHRLVGVEPEPGLSELLRGAELGGVLRALADDPLLHVVTSGSPVADPAGVVGGHRFAEVLESLDWAGMVVVDTPAGGLFADGLAIASQCDATVVVLDAQATRRHAARSLVQQLRQVGASPIGVVLNRSDAPSRAGYYYRSEVPAAT